MDIKISIIINNYNYGRFVSRAIESVLSQTIPPLELIVVDDGSTDNSREILNTYKDRAHIIFKENGGQASCFNAGYAAAKGNWLWFVDADDWLKEDAVASVFPLLNADCVKVHGPLLITSEAGFATGETMPGQPLSEGDVTTEIIESGDYVWPPTTGNIFSRKLLEGCMPVPEQKFRLSADFYLCSFAGIKGKVKAVQNPLGFYCVHSSNGFYGVDFNKTKLRRHGAILLTVVEHTEKLVREHLGVPGYTFPYNRRFLESLMLAKRAGGLELPGNVNNIITQQWLESKDVAALSGKAKLIAKTYWFVLSYAPVFIIKQFVKFGRRKHQKNQKADLS